MTRSLCLRSRTRLNWISGLCIAKLPLAFNAIECGPESGGGMLSGSESFVRTVGIAREFGPESLAPHISVVNIGSLVQGEVPGGASVRTVVLPETHGFGGSDGGYARFVGVKGGQRGSACCQYGCAEVGDQRRGLLLQCAGPDAGGVCAHAGREVHPEITVGTAGCQALLLGKILQNSSAQGKKPSMWTGLRAEGYMSVISCCSPAEGNYTSPVLFS